MNIFSNKRKFLIGIVILIISVLISATVYSFIRRIVPSMPIIQRSEFDFKLIYEINGEIKTVEDTLICKFVGYGLSSNDGIYRRWGSRLKSGDKSVIILQNDEIEIFYPPCNENAIPVYMGANEAYGSIYEVFPNAWWHKKVPDGERVSSYIISADELWNKYKIKLISWEIEPPIKNFFV